MSETEIKLGIYRHYKGPLYQVLGIAHDANADTLMVPSDNPTVTSPPLLGERTVVVYMPLQLDGAHLGPRMAVRTLKDFTAWVHENGQVCHGGDCDNPTGTIPRFTYLGPEFTAEMLTSQVAS